MRSRFLTEDDLKHFQRNGARVRGGVERSPSKTTENGHAVSANSGMTPGKASQLGERRLIGKPVSSPAPAPSRPHRYEYQGQVYKSKTEVRYAQYLDALKFAGEITSWQYEPVNFRLPGKKNYYKPDFLVRDTLRLTFYDTKGFNKSDERSLVKIKTAAGLNRWATFKQIRYLKGAWITRVIEVN